MARKKKSSSAVEAPIVEVVPANDVTTGEEEGDEEEEEEEMVYLQVDTGDIVKLKQILDETVASALLDDHLYLQDGTMEVADGKIVNGMGRNLVEDHKMNNIKLILMTVACAFAVVAQFAPLPFPESRMVLGACCAAYFTLSGILQLIITFYDGDCILITKVMTKDQTTEKILKTNPKLIEYGLRIRTSMPRFSEYYTVCIEFEGLEDSPCVSETWSVGKFFDVEGMFDEYGVVEEIDKLMTRFESGKFDTKDEKKDKEGSKKVKKS